MWKLFSKYEVIPEEFLEPNDVDSYFYHNIFDIFQFQHRMARFSGGSNKKSFAINLFEFCDLRTQQRYILQEVNLSKKGLTSLIDSLRHFFRVFDHASKCIRITLPKLKVDFGSTSKNNLFAQYYNDIIEHPNRQIHLSFRFGSNKSCENSIKKFELHGNQFILTETVNLHQREIHHLYKNRSYVANKCKIFESKYDV